MPSHSDAEYLREKAARYRKLAPQCETAMAAKLLELAIELEAKAAEIEAKSRPPRPLTRKQPNVVLH
jgi:hypothetical protein